MVSTLQTACGLLFCLRRCCTNGPEEKHKSIGTLEVDGSIHQMVIPIWIVFVIFHEINIDKLYIDDIVCVTKNDLYRPCIVKIKTSKRNMIHSTQQCVFGGFLRLVSAFPYSANSRFQLLPQQATKLLPATQVKGHGVMAQTWIPCSHSMFLRRREIYNSGGPKSAFLSILMKS